MSRELNDTRTALLT